jgi:hypothetical protein
MCNSSRMNLRRTSSVFSAAGGSNVSSEMFSKIRYFIDRVCCELTIRLILYNLQPRQYSPYIMYTSTPNIGFHSDPLPVQSGQGQPILTTDPLPCQNINTVLNDTLWMAYVRLSVGVGGTLDMFEIELFIRARFRAFFTHIILRLYMHIHYKLCIPFISLDQLVHDPTPVTSRKHGG